MKKVLALTATYPIHPRLIKIIESIIKNNKDLEINYFSFNLENKNFRGDNTNVQLCNYKYNNKIYKYITAILFLYKFIKKNKIELYICRGIIPFFFLNLITSKKNIYYDIPDLLENNRFFNVLEKLFLNKAQKIFLASRFFYKFYKRYSDKIIILENYPSKETYKLDLETKFNYHSENKILSFIGYIRYFEVLKNLVDSVKDKKIDILFFGSGSDENKLKNYCKENNIKNISFFGEYNYLDLYKFYNVSDFVWAAYDYRTDNVKYAISNKFYENILYEKIGIYSKFSELGNYIENNKIGLTIDCFNKKEMENLINSLINDNHISIIENIKKYKNIQKLFWEDQIEELSKLREEK